MDYQARKRLLSEKKQKKVSTNRLPKATLQSRIKQMFSETQEKEEGRALWMRQRNCIRNQPIYLARDVKSFKTQAKEKGNQVNNQKRE